MNEELPNDTESEKVVLGAILLDPGLLREIKTLLTPDRFYSGVHRAVYSAMIDQYPNIDPVLLSGKLRKFGVGVADLLDMTRGVPAVVPTEHINRIIRSARKRWIIKFAERLEVRAKGDETEDEVLSYAAEEIDRARLKLPGNGKLRFLSEMIDTQAERYRLWHRGISDALPTGIPVIDQHLQGGGLVGSGLYVLAARPSMGKSALGLDIAANVALRGKTVHIVSREMPAESLFDRLHSANSGVARWKFRSGIYQSDYQRLIVTLPNVCSLSIALDNLSTTVGEIYANCRELDRKHRRPDLVICDYIQLVDGTGRTRSEEVGSVTRSLKALAMEFQIPVIALSQLSRELEKQKREPELSDLRESGEIEQDADAVFFLFGDRPEENVRIYQRQFKCAKQRDGALFREELTFNSELVTFRSFEQLALAGAQELGGVS